MVAFKNNFSAFTKSMATFVLRLGCWIERNVLLYSEISIKIDDALLSESAETRP